MLVAVVRIFVKLESNEPSFCLNCRHDALKYMSNVGGLASSAVIKIKSYLTPCPNLPHSAYSDVSSFTVYDGSITTRVENSFTLL